MSANINWLWGCLGPLGLGDVLDLEPQPKVDAQSNAQPKCQDSARQDAGAVLSGIDVVVD
jgi:hypothetical protein